MKRTLLSCVIPVKLKLIVEPSGKTKQNFPEDNVVVSPEPELETTERVADEVRRKIESFCDRVEVVGSIGRCSKLQHHQHWKKVLI